MKQDLHYKRGKKALVRVRALRHTNPEDDQINEVISAGRADEFYAALKRMNADPDYQYPPYKKKFKRMMRKLEPHLKEQA